MQILFFSHWFPYPADNGSRIRISNLIKHLSWRHTVDVLSFTSEPQAVTTKYNWQTIGQDFIEFVEEISSRGRQAAGAAS